MASALALAMKLNRVLLLDPTDENPFCSGAAEGGGGTFRCGSQGNLECFFEPLSSCSTSTAQLKATAVKTWSDTEEAILEDERFLQAVASAAYSGAADKVVVGNW